MILVYYCDCEEWLKAVAAMLVEAAEERRREEKVKVEVEVEIMV